MRENRTQGSVREWSGNWRFYLDGINSGNEAELYEWNLKKLYKRFYAHN